jgi:hypothetical protein
MARARLLIETLIPPVTGTEFSFAPQAGSCSVITAALKGEIRLPDA